MAEEKPKCQSQFRDDWGKIWQCEQPWGHGIGVSSERIVHSAQLPAGWASGNTPVRFQWTKAQEVRQ